VNETAEKLKSLRRELHRFPEVSGEEEKTAAFINGKLSELNPDELITGIGRHGILAVFKAKRSSARKTILMRSELDALPIKEQNSGGHTSGHEGRMHACGHDGHMAIMLGLAEHISENRPDELTVAFIFQPAEETGEGAERVLADPKFKSFSADAAIALHNLPGYEENTLVLREETFACASEGLQIELNGQSSHAAYPEQGVSPAAALAQIIDFVNTGFSDESEMSGEPFFKVVITYARLGDRAFGISPGIAELGITFRAEDNSVQNQIRKKLLNKIGEIAGEAGLDYTTRAVEPFPATVNHNGLVKLAKKVAEKQGRAVVMAEDPFPWSEDFGHFSAKYPSLLFGVGVGVNHEPLHSAKYDFNDNIIGGSVRFLCDLLAESEKTDFT